MSETKNRFFRAVEWFSTKVAGPRRPILGVDSKLEEAIRALDAETGPGLFGRSRASRPVDIRAFFTWYDTDGVVTTAVDGLDEAATGQGYNNRMPDEYEPSEAEKSGDEIPRALELVNEFGRVLNLDEVNPNICRNMLIAGFCPVEVQIDRFPEKCALKVIHPKTVKEIVLGGKEYHGIDYIIQEVNSEQIKILGKNLAWFVHKQIANDKRGTSIIKPVSSLLAIKSDAVDSMGKIIDRYLAPLIIWKRLQKIGALKEAVEQRQPGEDIYLGNLTPEELASIAQVIEIRGEARFTEFIEYLDALIFRGLFAPDQYYSRNATEASARVMQELTNRNIHAIQRNMKRGIEAGFYARLMAANGIEWVPRLDWNVKKIQFTDLDIQLLILEGMRLGFVTDKNFEVLLKKAGLDIGELGYGVVPEEPEAPETEVTPEVEEPEDGEDAENLETLIE